MTQVVVPPTVLSMAINPAACQVWRYTKYPTHQGATPNMKISHRRNPKLSIQST